MFIENLFGSDFIKSESNNWKKNLLKLGKIFSQDYSFVTVQFYHYCIITIIAIATLYCLLTYNNGFKKILMLGLLWKVWIYNQECLYNGSIYYVYSIFYYIHVFIWILFYSYTNDSVSERQNLLIAASVHWKRQLKDALHLHIRKVLH